MCELSTQINSPNWHHLKQPSQVSLIETWKQTEFYHLPWIFRPILFLFRSNETTLTDTLSPRLTLLFFILEVWISPFCPTPISTNAPKWVTLVIFPVKTVPILRELTSWTSFLNNGFSKSGRIMHAFNIKCIAHLQIVF